VVASFPSDCMAQAAVLDRAVALLSDLDSGNTWSCYCTLLAPGPGGLGYTGRVAHPCCMVLGQPNAPGLSAPEPGRLVPLELLGRLGQPALAVCSGPQLAVAAGCQVQGNG
jgi:hypothetical protein